MKKLSTLQSNNAKLNIVSRYKVIICALLLFSPVVLNLSLAQEGKKISDTDMKKSQIKTAILNKKQKINLPEAASPGTVQISGEVIFEDCNTAMRNNIESAMSQIVNRFDDPATLSCLKDAVITEDQGSSPERILEKLSENMPTRIICHPAPCGGPGFDGCAGVGNGEEVFTLRAALAQNGPVERVAEVIVHEVAHRKNYGHPGQSSRTDYPFTIPVQAGSCVRKLNVMGLARSEAPGDTELAMFGGSGGNPFELRCPSGRLVTGMRVGSASDVNFVTLHCGSINVGPAGEQRGTSRTEDRSCSSGDVAIGLRLQAGNLVNRISMECASLAVLAADQIDTTTSLIFLGGEGAGPLSGTRVCPKGMAINGLRGRAGARIDRIRVMCEDVNTKRQPASKALALVGNKNGIAKAEHCLGHGAAISVYGHSGGGLDRLGLACQATRSSGSMINPAQLVGSVSLHAIDWNGGNGGTPFVLPCPSNMVAVGLEFRERTGVDAVRVGCSGLNDWKSGAAAPIRFTGWTGQPQGEVISRLCPQGAFLSGLLSWSKKTVHKEPTLQGVQPVCRAINYAVGMSAN
jgi:hypothetical protein